MVQGGRQAAVSPVGPQRDPGIIPGQVLKYGPTAVGGAIIDDDQVPIPIGLVLDAPDSLGHGGFSVVHSHDDRDVHGIISIYAVHLSCLTAS